LVASVSVAVDRVAEEIAREALADDEFRRAIKELVRQRSEQLLDRLLRDGRKTRRREVGGKQRRFGKRRRRGAVAGRGKDGSR
jgi:hypothetical protein